MWGGATQAAQSEHNRGAATVTARCRCPAAACLSSPKGTAAAAILTQSQCMPSYACIWFCAKMLGGRNSCEIKLRSYFLQESSMETLQSIASACTACPLLLQLCSRVLQHSLQTPSEILSCLQSSPDVLGVLTR